MGGTHEARILYRSVLGSLPIPQSVDIRGQDVKGGPNGIFKHKNLTQPLLPPNDMLIHAMDDLCKILKNCLPLKEVTRTAIDMLVDVFKGYEGEPINIDEHQAKMKMASKAKEESNIEEDQVNIKELKNEDLDKENSKSETNSDLEDQDIYTKDNELE